MNAIRDANTALPLIVLSSCAGAADGEALAAALIDAGADRILAMQAPVSDTYATRLLAQFYRELLVPPSGAAASAVAGALGRARRAVERARPADDREPRPEYGVATLLCAGTDTALIDASRPLVSMPSQVVPSGTSVRELGLGQLIGRRSQLREATQVLRRTKPAVEEYGAISGAQLIGVGGIGKTALAGRLVTRLRGDGMLPVVHEGRWNPSQLFAGLAAVLAAVRTDDPVAAALAAPDLPETAKAALVGQVLDALPVVLIFDDFEQNLSPGGAAFRDPAFDELFTAWCGAARAGVILVTCQYPLPGDEDRYLVPIAVGPLSPAELRRLLLRLPALRGMSGDDLRVLTRTIGGHPRLIEYVDALLRGRPARFREVQTKLKDLARREGIDLRKPRPVGVAVEDALLLGGADILLDELLDLLTDHETEVLRQLAVSRATMTLDELALVLTGLAPDTAAPLAVAQLAAEVEHLTDLTLLVPAEEILVHPWTAELLQRRPDPDRVRRHEHALAMRLQRLQRGRVTYDDLIDIARHQAAIGQQDQIPGLARRVVAALPGVLAAAAYLAEIRPLIPTTQRAWEDVAKLEYEAVRAAGDLTSAGALLREMQHRIDERLATDPHDIVALADMSVLLVDLGDLAVAVGDLDTARGHYQAALDLDPAQSADLTEPWWQNRPSLVRNRLGDVAVSAGDLTTAAEHYEAGLVIAQRLAVIDPDNTGWQRDLAISRNKLGDVAVAVGDLTAAAEHYQAGLAIAQRLAAADPRNTEWQRDLSISRDRLGNVAVAAGDLTAAAEHYQAGLEIAQRLAAADPGNSGWQRDLSISLDHLGDVARAAGDLAAAAEHYQAGLTIAQRLAAADPGNSGWQRDLSISRNKLGDVAGAAGDLVGAAEHYQAGLVIAQRLAAADPRNTEWQRDLSISRNRLGDIAGAAGDLTAAAEHYEAALVIAERLAAADPRNTEWQRDVAAVRVKLEGLAETDSDDEQTA